MASSVRHSTRAVCILQKAKRFGSAQTTRPSASHAKQLLLYTDQLVCDLQVCDKQVLLRYHVNFVCIGTCITPMFMHGKQVSGRLRKQGA